MDEPENAVCEACGYPTRGLDLSALAPRCPECGTPVSAAEPWVPRPLPNPVIIALHLSGPAVACIALFLAMSTWAPARNWLVWPLWTLWLIATLGLAWFWPEAQPRRLAALSRPESERRRTALRLFWPAFLLNLFTAGAAAVVFFRILR